MGVILPWVLCNVCQNCYIVCAASARCLKGWELGSSSFTPACEVTRTWWVVGRKPILSRIVLSRFTSCQCYWLLCLVTICQSSVIESRNSREGKCQWEMSILYQGCNLALTSKLMCADLASNNSKIHWIHFGKNVFVIFLKKKIFDRDFWLEGDRTTSSQ